jgi:YidC/Oxa1 family membrane protein insertase
VEKRTQLAFLLIAVILITNLLVMRKIVPPPEEAPETPPVQTEEGFDPNGSIATGGTPTDNTPATMQASPTPNETTRPPLSTQTDSVFPLATGDELEIIVETPLQRIVIDQAGAVFTSVTLPLFISPHGGNVNLMEDGDILSGKAPHGAAALGVVLDTPDGLLDLTTVRFTLVEGLQGPDGVVRLDESSGPVTLSFRCEANGGGAVIKRFTFHPDRYDIDFDLQLERGAALQQVESWTLAWTRGLPSTEQNETQDYQAFKAFASTNREVSSQGMGGGMMASLRGSSGQGEKSQRVAGEIDWISMRTKYFMVAIIPQTLKVGSAVMRGDSDSKWMGIELTQPRPWQHESQQSYQVYVGPISHGALKAKGIGLENVVDLGYKWIRPFSSAILWCMQFLYGFIGNYGVVILIVSVITKVMFWPLSEKSFKSMREMQAVQPLMAELKERYKDNPQEMNKQVMQLYKTRGVNPLGGCLPMVVQMPIFFALYAVMRSNIELRYAPFFGWIDNLAAPDVLFTFPFTLPFLGSAFSLLPLLMGIAMIWQTKMGSPMSMSGPAAQQQAIMKWVMPVMFIFIFYSMPSGLVLYWLVNTVVSVWQQMKINNKYAAVPAAGPVEEAPKEAQGGNNGGASDRNNRGDRRRGNRERTRKAGSKSK